MKTFDTTLSQFLADQTKGQMLPVPEMGPRIPGTIGAMVDPTFTDCARVKTPEHLLPKDIIHLLCDYFNRLGYTHDLGVSADNRTIIGSVYIPEADTLGVCAFYEDSLERVLCVNLLAILC